MVSTDEIVWTALALIEERGYGRFSVNEVASRLGVTPRAVRYRVGSRDELTAAAAEAVVATIDVPSPDGLDWDDWLRLVATAVRSRLVDRPGLVPLVLEQWASTRSGAQLVGATLDVLLEAAGHDLAGAVTAHNTFWAFLAGAVYAQGAPAPAAAARGQSIRAISGHDDVYQALERLRESYAAAYPGADAADVVFSAALNVTLLGLRASLNAAEPRVRKARS